jgi:hypothetical protein
MLFARKIALEIKVSHFLFFEITRNAQCQLRLHFTGGGGVFRP